MSISALTIVSPQDPCDRPVGVEVDAKDFVHVPLEIGSLGSVRHVERGERRGGRGEGRKNREDEAKEERALSLSGQRVSSRKRHQSMGIWSESCVGEE